MTRDNLKQGQRVEWDCRYLADGSIAYTYLCVVATQPDWIDADKVCCRVVGWRYPDGRESTENTGGYVHLKADELRAVA